MKNSVFTFTISILIVTGCYAQKNTYEQIDSSVLNFYRQYSTFTDPGEYAYLYKNLPDSLPELCSLIKSQFIHPYDSSGLTKERKPEDRLILGCQQNAILLASILKYRGIPARVRCGHVTYLIPDFHTSHTICEVWNEDENRWMLVDPSTDRIDFSHEKFDFSYDAWLQMQNGEIDPNQYGIPSRYSGFVSIVAKVNTDLASVLGTEYPINQYAPMLEYAFENDDQLTAEHIETLNNISELMRSLDADNISKLREIYSSTPEIQITKSFESISEN